MSYASETYEPTKISELIKQFTDTLTRPNNWGQRQDINWKARYNIWPGQDPSGRKRKNRLGKEPFPFDEASDARVPLVDCYANEDVDTMMTALDSARLLAVPTEANDMARANLVTNFMRWMFYNQMPEQDREAELLANYVVERGLGILAVLWRNETQVGIATLTMQEIAARAPKLVEVIQDPTREDEAVDLAMKGLPDLKKSDARSLVVALREKGEGQYPQEYVKENRPTVVALCPGEDFFAPADVTDLQNARVLFYREFKTKASLEDAETSYKWDGAWIKAVIAATKGKASSMTTVPNRTTSYPDKDSFGGLDTSELYEVIHSFERRCDGRGVPGIYYTVFSAHLPTNTSGEDIYAYRDLLNYQHGKQPFIAFSREHVNRRLDSARGYGELAATWQNQIKTEWDSRVDRASVATHPPLMHPVGRAPTKWGPGVRVPYVRPKEYFYADIPEFDQGSREVEESVRAFADQYFGRMVEGRDPTFARMRQQRMVTRWLKGWRQALEQMFQLCQQFMPDEFWFRVVGSAKAQPLRATRAEIQGKFDVHLSWNVLNQDAELLAAKIKLLLEVLQADINAVVDRTELMTVIFEYLDPNLGERLLQPLESASQREVEDEKTVLARMLGGMDEDVKPEGQAYQLRQKVLDGELTTNPVAQQIYTGNPRVKEVIDKRRKQLAFQIQQKMVNPQIGRLGA